MPGLLFETANVPVPVEFFLGDKQVRLEPLGGQLLALYVKGNPTDWYWWGMDYAEHSLGRMSFIGIDSEHAYPCDTYNLEQLSSISHVPTFWSTYETHYMKRLCGLFSDAIRAYEYSDIEVDRIAKVSVLGEDPDYSVNACCGKYQRCLRLSKREFLDDMLSGFHWDLKAHNSISNNFTFVRFMAHFCYLHSSQKPAGIGTIITRLFGGN